jgi:FkbM family methyltransferase
MNARSRRMTSLEREFIRTSRLLKKDPSGINHWLTPRGSYWVPAGSDAPNSEFRLPFRELAEQEVAIYGTGAQSVRPGDTVLDCGANIGAYTRTALAAGAQLVVAIEPAPENLACLRRNLAEEINAGRVILYGKGVWDKDDILSLNILPTTSAGDTFLPRADATRTVRVPVTTIDKIVSELHLQRCQGRNDSKPPGRRKRGPLRLRGKRPSPGEAFRHCHHCPPSVQVRVRGRRDRLRTRVSARCSRSAR